MTDKEALIEELNALADGHLTKAKAEEIQKLVQANPQLTIHYASIVNIKLAVSQLPKEAQPELMIQVKSRLAEIDRVKKADQFVSRYAWGLCGIVLLTIVGAGAYTRLHGNSVGLSDVPGYSAGLVSPTLDNAPQGIASWLKRLIVGSPAQQSAPLRVLKEDVGSMGGVPAARVILGNPSDPYTLFIVNSSNPIQGVHPIDGTAQSHYWVGNVGPCNCLNWRQGGYQLVLVGKHSESDLESIANSIHVR